jgi:hypothetical protein
MSDKDRYSFHAGQIALTKILGNKIFPLAQESAIKLAHQGLGLGLGIFID